MEYPPIEAIVAVDQAGGIGKAGDIPWKLPPDLKRFAKLTKGPKGVDNAVLMGRKTWESLPEKYRPLKGRFNIVLSRTPSYSLGGGMVALAGGMEKALRIAVTYSTLFAIGGREVYSWAIAHPACRKVHVTQVRGDFQCDVYLPSLTAAGWHPVELPEWEDYKGLQYRHVDWVR